MFIYSFEIQFVLHIYQNVIFLDNSMINVVDEMADGNYFDCFALLKLRRNDKLNAGM